MKTRIVENADSVGRESAAGRSLAQWFRRESGTLNRAIQIGREALTANPGDTETRQSVGDLERQLQELYAGWDKSTLRKHIMERAVADAGGAERRSVTAVRAGPPVTAGVRAADVASAVVTAKRIEGYAAVYNSLSPNWAGWQEKIAQGAFRKALETSDVRMLFNHDANHLFARSSATTLELAEDSHGLHFRAYLLPFDGPSYGLARRIDRGDICGCSFSFSGVTDEWILKPGQTDIRILKTIDTLYDVGPVVYPFYPATTVAAVFETVKRATPAAESDVTAARTRKPRRVSTFSERQYRRRQLDQLRFEWRQKNHDRIDREKRYWLALGLSDREADEKIELLFLASLA